VVYPEGIDRFSEKLNKKQDGGVHTIEEALQLENGQYEGWLAHDNIINGTVRVYTGPRFTGEEIATWTLSAPADSPWRRTIRVFANVESLYVTYETPGDTVDADDVNVLQEAITATQTEMDRYKEAGMIDGGTFYEGE